MHPFETALEELEKRVRRLESGDVPLEEALTLFEEGVALARGCHEQLDQATERVAALSRAKPSTRSLKTWMTQASATRVCRLREAQGI